MTTTSTDIANVTECNFFNCVANILSFDRFEPDKRADAFQFGADNNIEQRHALDVNVIECGSQHDRIVDDDEE